MQVNERTGYEVDVRTCVAQIDISYVIIRGGNRSLAQTADIELGNFPTVNKAI